jgi:hypothetical protein
MLFVYNRSNCVNSGVLIRVFFFTGWWGLVFLNSATGLLRKGQIVSDEMDVIAHLMHC